MKKGISGILILALLLTMLTPMFALASTPSDVDNTKYEGAVAQLTSLGVVNGYPDGTFKPNNEITRAEFAKIVANAAGFADAAKLLGNTDTGFKDVNSSHWASGYIAVAASKGYVKGYPDGTFNPEGKITNSEVITILLRVLGYNDNLVGKWPTNYVIKATELGIGNGVDFATNSKATRGDVAIFVVNALETETVTYSKDSNDFTGTGNDLLSKSFALAFKPAVLTSGSLDKDGKVQLNGSLYSTKDLYVEGGSLSALLAHDVEYLVVDNKVTYIRDAQKSSNVISAKYTGLAIAAGTLDKADTFTFENVNGTFSILNDGTNVTAKLYVNGTEVAPANFSLANAKKVDAYLTTVNNATVVRSIVVNTYDYSDVVVTDITQGYKQTTFSFDGGTVIADNSTAVSGDATTVSGIKKGDVLRVKLDPSKVNTAKSIEVNRSMVQGKVTYNNTTTSKATINGVTYDYATGVTLTTGVDYKAYTNVDGKIVKATPVSATNDDVVFVKVDSYNELDGTKVNAVRDLVVLNADGTKQALRIKDASITVPGTIAAGDVINYTVVDGKVTVVAEVQDSVPDDYNTSSATGAAAIAADGINKTYNSITVAGPATHYVSSSTVYVDVTDATNGPAITSLDKLAVGNEIKAYTINDVQYVFVYTKNVVVENPNGVFLGVISKLDADNKVVNIAQLLVGNEIKEYTIEGTGFSALNSGVLVTLSDIGANGGTINNGKYDNVASATQYNQITASSDASFTVNGPVTYRVSPNTKFYIVTEDSDGEFVSADVTAYGTLKGYTGAPANTVKVQVVADAKDSNFAGSVVVTVTEE